MTKQSGFMASALFLGGIALAVVGCGSSTGSVPSGSGGAGGKGGGGTGAIGGFDPTQAIPATGTVLETFDDTAKGVDGFKINNYDEKPPSVTTNLGGTLSTATVAATTVEWDATVGSPTLGSLKINAPFSAFNQYVDVLKTVTPMGDWSGKKIHARVMVDSGFVTDMYVKGIVQMYFDTGTSYVFAMASMPPMVVSGSGWQDYILDTATAKFAATGGDPTMVVQYGIQFHTGAGSMTAGTVPPSAAIFHVDSFWLE